MLTIESTRYPSLLPVFSDLVPNITRPWTYRNVDETPVGHVFLSERNLSTSLHFTSLRSTPQA